MNNRIRQLREAAGFTQASLAQMAGVSRQAINALESGKYDPSIWLAYALSKVFKLPIEDIFIFEEGEASD